MQVCSDMEEDDVLADETTEDTWEMKVRRQKVRWLKKFYFTSFNFKKLKAKPIPELARQQNRKEDCDIPLETIRKVQKYKWTKPCRVILKACHLCTEIMSCVALSHAHDKHNTVTYHHHMSYSHKSKGISYLFYIL